MEVLIGTKRIKLDPQKSIGKGGEADIFDIGNGMALKLFKQPDHPDYSNSPTDQEGAGQRLAVHQEKLRVFPKNLPPRVVSPEELVYERTQQKVIGYTMKKISGEVLIRFADKNFREGKIGNHTIVNIFKNLHETVDLAHRANAVIGDFNDLNIIVEGKDTPYIIDADSFQFGKFLAVMFTQKFLDPTLSDPSAHSPVLSKPYNANSDWYSFAVMLMECLLFVDPYGGVYKPKDWSRRVPHDKRPLMRITVFNPEVKYPKPAIPYIVLPDDLLHYFHKVFEKDERGSFPLKFLDYLRWQKCPNCSMEHARRACPICFNITPPSIKETVTIRGKIKEIKFFRTKGLILFAAIQENKLLWLWHEDNKFFREDKTKVAEGVIDQDMRFRLQGKTTLIGKNNEVLVFKPGEQLSRLTVDSYGTLPIFDANSTNYFWAENGEIKREGDWGPETIGSILPNQTLFWVGPKFGFGFYRAGKIFTAFVFDAKKSVIKDTIVIPPIRGQLIDSTCFFTKDWCWFLTSTNENGKVINRCLVIRPDGSLEAVAEASKGDGSWLSSIRGKCAVQNMLLSAGDDGIVRVEPNGGLIIKVREFPDTESFVDSGSHLLPANDGIYVVAKQEIKLLSIA